MVRLKKTSGSNTKTCFRVPLKKKRSRPIRCCLVQRLPGAVLSVFVAWASLGKTGWLGSFVTTLLPVYPFSTPTTARQSANNMSDKEILSQSKRLKKKSNLLWEAFLSRSASLHRTIIKFPAAVHFASRKKLETQNLPFNQNIV